MNLLFIAMIGGIGALLGWGISDFFAKKIVDKIGDLVSLFWMQTLSMIILLSLFLVRSDVSILRLKTLGFFFIYGTMNACAYYLFYRALEKGKVSIVSPIVSSYGALSMIVSAAFFSEILSGIIIFLLLGIIFGIILTSVDFSKTSKDLNDRKNISRGVIEAIASAILFAIWFPFWDHFVSSENLDVFALLLGLKIFVSLTLFLFAKLKKCSLRIGSGNIFKTLLVIACLDLCAYFSLTWGYGRSTYTSVVSVLAAAFPVPTLILARVFLKERLKATQYIGIFIIIVGLIALAGMG